MYKKIAFITIAILCFTFLPRLPHASALEIAPFDSVNQSPLVGIYGLPGPGNFLLLSPGLTEVGMNVALSSNYAVNDTVRERIILDGETTRFTFTARHALSSRLEVGMKIPYIIQGGGFLDGFIESYHSAFSFPQGGRDQAPRNRLLYRYSKNGVDRMRMDASGAGIGDVMLTSAFQLYQKKGDNQLGITLNAGLKLPTGDSDYLRGSGGTDLALWMAGGADLGHAAGKWTSYGSAGMLFMTEGDILPDQQKRWAGFGSLGLGWVPRSWLAFKVQADAHTPFFGDSDLKEIASNALQLIIGGTIGFSEKTTLDIGVSEDLAVNTSPDVVFYLNLKKWF
jgi:hypothetical protein